MTKAHLVTTSYYIPDFVLHELNGSCLVDLAPMKRWLASNAAWLSPDDAEAFAASLMDSATLARDGRESSDD